MRVTSLTLKIIAVITMLIDHTAACLNLVNILPYGELYMMMRCIGRMAFPIYCFLIVEGAVHTHHKGKYLFRLLLLAVISEIPFDLSLFATWSWVYWGNQNVFFTLALGLCCIYVLQALRGKPYRWVVYAGVTVALGFVARLIHCDYGMGGVFTIAIMGVLADPLMKIRKAFPYENHLRCIVFSVAMLVCAYFAGTIELVALVDLILLSYYNGQKGFSNKAIQYGFYLFYPIHLLILGVIFVLPRIM